MREEYKYIGSADIHFAESGSDADSFEAVVVAQTLRESLNHEDGNYKLYIKIVKGGE